MNVIIFSLVLSVTWLSLISLKITLGRESMPKFLISLNRRLYAIASFALAIISLFGLCQVFPTLQSVFAWLGLISLCGIAVATKTSNEPNNK